jgi:hypothetical protein
VRIYKGKKHGGIFGQGRTGTFGYKLFYPIDTVVNQTQTSSSTNFALDYNGIALGGSRGDGFLFESFVQQV